MSTNYKKLGDYITQRREKNTTINLPICGLCREGLIPPKQQDADISLYNVFYKNDFIFNPARMELNSITLNTEYDKAICSSLYEIFYINDTSKLLPEFLFVQLKTDNFVRFCEFQGQGSVREYCRFANISEYPVIVPDLKEQEKIVNTYNAITKRIQLKQKINENLEKTAQTIYRKMFVEDADKNWKIGKLSDYCKFQEGYVNPPQEYPEYFDGMIKWLRAVDINESYVLNTSRTLTDLGFKSAGTSALLFKPNTIAITKSGTIGRLAIISDFMCGNRAIINIEPNEKLYLPFIHQYLKSRQKEFLDMSVGSVQKNLYVSILAELPIIKPELSSVEEYYKTVECLYEQKLYNCKEISKLQELKQLVISRISGM